MAEYKTGQVVFSKRGRDKGLPFIIVKVEGEYLYLADGALRKLKKPKKKKAMHVQPTKYVDADLGGKLAGNCYLLDADIRKSICCYRDLSCESNKEVKYLV